MNTQAMSAKTTASGSEPPAYAAPNGIDAAIAAPGAMSVMLWKRTSRRPIASLRNARVAGSVWGGLVDLPHLIEASGGRRYSPVRGLWSIEAHARPPGPCTGGVCLDWRPGWPGGA